MKKRYKTILLKFLSLLLLFASLMPATSAGNPPKQVSVSLLRSDMRRLREQSKEANQNTLPIFFDFIEGIVKEAECMIEAARLSAMYLNDYPDEAVIKKYEAIQDEALAIARKLARKHGVELPSALKKFDASVALRYNEKKGDFEVTIGDSSVCMAPDEALKLGVIEVFVELPGNLCKAVKFIGLDLPVWLLGEVFEYFTIEDPDMVKEELRSIKDTSKHLLAHYNAVSEESPSVLELLVLLKRIDEFGKYDLDNLMEHSDPMMHMGSRVLKSTGSIVKDLSFGSRALLTGKQPFKKELDYIRNGPPFSKEDMAELGKIKRELRSALGLLPVYPDLPERLDMWWDAKSLSEKFRTIGRGVGEALLFFYGGDICSAIATEAGELASAIKSFASGGKAAKTVRLAKLSEGGVSLAKATRMAARGEKISKIALSLEEFQQAGKSLDVLRKAKSIEIFVEGAELAGNLGKVSKRVVDAFSSIEKATDITLIVSKKGGKLTKIFTTGVQHGTKGHWETILKNALAIAKKRGYEHIFLNRSIGTAFKQAGHRVPSGLLEHINKRPDIFAIGKRGRNLVLEVISPSQNTVNGIKALREKLKIITELSGDKIGVLDIGELSPLVT